jgi:hypothetical protein
MFEGLDFSGLLSAFVMFLQGIIDAATAWFAGV